VTFNSHDDAQLEIEVKVRGARDGLVGALELVLLPFGARDLLLAAIRACDLALHGAHVRFKILPK